jgi:hypothetical protein
MISAVRNHLEPGGVHPAITAKLIAGEFRGGENPQCTAREPGQEQSVPAAKRCRVRLRHGEDGRVVYRDDLPVAKSGTHITEVEQ